MLCVLYWIVVIVIVIFFFEIESMCNNRKVCNVYVLYGIGYEKFWVVYCFSLLCIVILIVICYIKILFMLWRLLYSVVLEDNNKFEMIRWDIMMDKELVGGGLSLMFY